MRIDTIDTNKVSIPCLMHSIIKIKVENFIDFVHLNVFKLCQKL